MEPDPDYEPEVGEWFWEWLGSCNQWSARLQRLDGNKVSHVSGSDGGSIQDGQMLPATAPE